MRFVFNIFSEEKPLRMLAFPGLFLLCFSVYILHTHLYTHVQTLVQTHVHILCTHIWTLTRVRRSSLVCLLALGEPSCPHGAGSDLPQAEFFPPQTRQCGPQPTRPAILE